MARPLPGPHPASGTAGVGRAVHSSPVPGWAGRAAGPRPWPGHTAAGKPGTRSGNPDTRPRFRQTPVIRRAVAQAGPRAAGGRVRKLAGGGRAPASGSGQGRGAPNRQLLPPPLRVGKAELSDCSPPPALRIPTSVPGRPPGAAKPAPSSQGPAPESPASPLPGSRAAVAGQESLRTETLGSRSGILKVHAGQRRGRPGSGSYLARAAAASLGDRGSGSPCLASHLRRPQTSGLALPPRPGRRAAAVPGALPPVRGGGGGSSVTPGSGAIKAPVA